MADPVLTDILVPTKAAIAAIGPNMAKIILGALVVLLILAVLQQATSIRRDHMDAGGHPDRVRKWEDFLGCPVKHRDLL